MAGAKDVAGNTQTAATFINRLAIHMNPGSDSTQLTVTKIERFNPSDQVNNAPVLVFHVTFSEPVDPLTVGHTSFVVSGGSTAGVNFTQEVNGTHQTVFEVWVLGGNIASFSGSIGLNVSPNPRILDLAGNVLVSAEPGVDQTYTRSGGASLSFAGPVVTRAANQSPVKVLPTITVSGGSLTSSVLVIAIDSPSKKSPLKGNSLKGIGLAEKAVLANGKVTVVIHLGPNATASNVQNYLRSLTFAAKGKNLAPLVRTLGVTLASMSGQSSVTQTVTLSQTDG